MKTRKIYCDDAPKAEETANGTKKHFMLLRCETASTKGRRRTTGNTGTPQGCFCCARCKDSLLGRPFLPSRARDLLPRACSLRGGDKGRILRLRLPERHEPPESKNTAQGGGKE
ncbi:unnamed protein product [Arctogadus glacialis]